MKILKQIWRFFTSLFVEEWDNDDEEDYDKETNLED